MSRRERRPHRKSRISKRTVAIAGRKTSISLENEFWESLTEIATGHGMSRPELISAIKSERRHGNLSSAIRLFVLDFYRQRKRRDTAKT